MTDLFGGAAPYYAKYRTGYGDGVLDHLASVFGSGSTVLDLGCGPGTVAIPLAARVRQVLAVDPDEGMLAEGRRNAPGNVRWITGDSTQIPKFPEFGQVVMGRSFHWMDRPAVLAALDERLPPDGAIALLGPGKDPLPEPWEEVTAAVRDRFRLGGLTAAGSFQHSGLHPHDVLADSPFSAMESAFFEFTLTRDVRSVIGLQLSYSFSAPARLGDRLPDFVEALEEALLAANPAGRWEERVVTEVLTARRCSPAR